MRRYLRLYPVLVLLLFCSACGDEDPQPVPLATGVYEVFDIATTGDAAPIPKAGDRLRFIDDPKIGAVIEIDGTIFSDATDATPVVYRWQVPEPGALSFEVALEQGGGNEFRSINGWYRYWTASLSVDNRQETGTLTVTFYQKTSDSAVEPRTVEQSFKLRRKTDVPPLRLIDDPYVHTYDYVNSCYDFITGDERYETFFQPLPDLQTAVSTDVVMECGFYETFTGLSAGAKNSFHVQGTNDFMGRWKTVPLQIVDTDCGKIRPFRIERTQGGSTVSANSNLPGCGQTGGIIYHLW